LQRKVLGKSLIFFRTRRSIYMPFLDFLLLLLEKMTWYLLERSTVCGNRN